MEQTIELKGKKINYLIRRSWRAKRISLTVHNQAGFVVSVPLRIKSQRFIENFIIKNSNWIIKQINHYQQNTILLPEVDFKACKDKSLEFVRQRVRYFNQYYGFNYKKIKVKNMRRIWGSCSSDKNLNYNYRLVFLPSKLADYVVVHELCHLKQLNHSKNFWNLVALTVPDHKIRRKQLKTINF